MSIRFAAAALVLLMICGRPVQADDDVKSRKQTAKDLDELKAEIKAVREQLQRLEERLAEGSRNHDQFQRARNQRRDAKIELLRAKRDTRRVAGPHAESSAEQLMRRLGEMLSKASTLNVAVEGKIQEHDGSKEGFKFKGSMHLLMKGNKVYVKANGKLNIQEEQSEFAYVSNGSEDWSKGSANREKFPLTPAQMSQHVINSLKGPGLLAGLELSDLVVAEGVQKTSGNSVFHMSALKLGKRERIGDRDAQVVEYQLTVKSEDIKLPFAVKLWFDAQTGLPLKRTVSVEAKGTRLAFTENYTKFAIDQKVDEKRFELPK